MVNPVFVEEAMGIDTLSWSVTLEDPSRSVAGLVPDTGEVITLWQDDTVKFQGWAKQPELTDDGSGCKVQVNIFGPAWWLKQEPISDTPTDDLGLAGKRTSYVFQQDTVSNMIAALFDRAVTLGLPVALGTVSTTFVLPRVTLQEMTFLDALAELCRPVADGVGYWDYSTFPAKFHFVRRGDMPDFVFRREEIIQGGLNYLSSRVSPREDLVITSVTCPFVERLPDGRSAWNNSDAQATQANAIVFNGPNGQLEITSRLPGSAGNNISVSAVSAPANGVNYVTLKVNTPNGVVPVPYVLSVNDAAEFIGQQGAQPASAVFVNSADVPCVKVSSVLSGVAGNGIIVEHVVPIWWQYVNASGAIEANVYNPPLGVTMTESGGIKTFVVSCADDLAKTFVNMINTHPVSKPFLSAELLTIYGVTLYDWMEVASSGYGTYLYTPGTPSSTTYNGYPATLYPYNPVVSSQSHTLSGANDGAAAWVYASVIGQGTDDVTEFPEVPLQGGSDAVINTIGQRQMRTVSGPEMAAFLPSKNLESCQIQTAALAPVNWNMISALDSYWANFRALYPTITPNIGQTTITLTNAAGYAPIGGITVTTTTYALGAPPICMDDFGNIIDITQWDRLFVGTIPEWLEKDFGIYTIPATIRGAMYYSQVIGNSSGTFFGLPAWWPAFAQNATLNVGGYNGGNFYACVSVPYTLPVTLINVQQRSLNTFYRSADYDYVRPPATLAADLLAAQSFVPYQGEIKGVADELVLGGWLGKKFGIANCLPAYAGMGALARSAAHEIYTGRLTLKIGPPERQTYDGLVSKLRRNPADNITVLD